MFHSIPEATDRISECEQEISEMQAQISALRRKINETNAEVSTAQSCRHCGSHSIHHDRDGSGYCYECSASYAWNAEMGFAEWSVQVDVNDDLVEVIQAIHDCAMGVTVPGAGSMREKMQAILETCQIALAKHKE